MSFQYRHLFRNFLKCYVLRFYCFSCFLFNCHRFIPLSHTNYKMLQNPDPEKQENFLATTMYLFFFVSLFLFFFNVTRVQGSFLDISALKIKTDDQHWPFKGARVQSKLARSFTMWKKFRLHAFTFSNIIYSITCCTLLNKIYVSESVTSLRRQVSKEMTGESKPARAVLTFLPSFQDGTQNPQSINKSSSIK